MSVPTYSKLYNSWKAAYPLLSGKTIQDKVNQFWKENKTNGPSLVDKCKQLDEFKLKRKSANILLFINSSAASRAPTTPKPPEPVLVAEPSPVVLELQQSHNIAKKHPAPSQEKLKLQISELNEKLCALEALKCSGLANTDTLLTLTRMKKEKSVLVSKLESLQKKVVREAQYRSNKKAKIESFTLEHPEHADTLKGVTQKKVGRPIIENEHPEIVKAIIDIVSPAGAADPRRRSELLKTCVTLDDLKAQLTSQGIELSRSALYYRLLPRNSKSLNGRRHVHTVPVRLLRAENSDRKPHIDCHFAAITVKYLKDIAELFGTKVVFCLSQDDKARVPLGLTAAKLQAPILMHLEYRVKLPDHDWGVASRHKLIPSVYAALNFNVTGNLSYSGPTYIAIRSGKHDSSTAESHAVDFRRLIELQSFEESAKWSGAGNSLKPILIVFSDGSTDENPRHPRVMVEAVQHFKEFDLDCLFIATNAPGYSAYNPVERRMALLSHDLAGIILPHDHYGNHLDAKGNTIDRDLEKKNFQKAGECLSSIWSERKIDGFDAIAEYVTGFGRPNPSFLPTEEWKSIHVRQAHYFLQIIKCKNSDCCKPWRTNYISIFPDRFLPAPVLFSRESSGVVSCQPECQLEHKHGFPDLSKRIALKGIEPLSLNFKILPYDFYCPSQQPHLKKRACETCGTSFATKTALTKHKTVHKKNRANPDATINPAPEQHYQVPLDSCDDLEDGIQVIEDMAVWIRSPFEDDC